MQCKISELEIHFLFMYNFTSCKTGEGKEVVMHSTADGDLTFNEDCRIFNQTKLNRNAIRNERKLQISYISTDVLLTIIFMT
jgi:hypothetical protein